MTNKIKEFTYTDKKGKVTNRVTYTIHPASPKMLALDLTEYSIEERNILIAKLQEADDVYKGSLENLGLGSQYRFFIKENMNEN